MRNTLIASPATPSAGVGRDQNILEPVRLVERFRDNLFALFGGRLDVAYRGQPFPEQSKDAMIAGNRPAMIRSPARTFVGISISAPSGSCSSSRMIRVQRGCRGSS